MLPSRWSWSPLPSAEAQTQFFPQFPAVLWTVSAEILLREWVLPSRSAKFPESYVCVLLLQHAKMGVSMGDGFFKLELPKGRGYAAHHIPCRAEGSSRRATRPSLAWNAACYAV